MDEQLSKQINMEYLQKHPEEYALKENDVVLPSERMAQKVLDDIHISRNTKG